MKKSTLTLCLLMACCSLFAQQQKTSFIKTLTPYVGALGGGPPGNKNLVSFLGGVQKNLPNKGIVSFDVHYWRTNYECYNISYKDYRLGKYTYITPSVKIQTSTGKHPGTGLIIGAGLGYMFAKGRGIERTYSRGPGDDIWRLGEDINTGRWDFGSIAPSFTLGVGFRIAKVPVSVIANYYYAKSDGVWGITAGGVGIKIGLTRK